MRTEIIVLVTPLLLLLFPTIFINITSRTPLFSKRVGPILSADAIEQLSLLFVIYIILMLVPIGGKIAGKWGQPIAMLLFFVIVTSLAIRFKKLGND
jgi:hypothetical protein